MKKFFATVFLLAAVLSAMKGCEKEVTKRGDPIIHIPAAKQTETVNTQEGNSIIAPYGESVQYVSFDYSQEGVHDFYTIVNDTIYQNLKTAKASFEKLLDKGYVPNQMRQNGTNVNDGDADFIDGYIRYMYGLVCDYVYGYEAQNWNGCYEAGRAMCEADVNGINKSYLFDMLVASKLPREYNDGSVHVDYRNNIYDTQGFIVMTNGRRLHNVGMADAILSNNADASQIYNVSGFYCAVPQIITDQYAVVQNSQGDDGICHVWNQTNAERCCRMEWKNIMEVGQSMYGCDPKTTSVRWEESAGCYIFVGNNGEIYGPADWVTCERIFHVIEVQEAIANGSGNVYDLDAYIDAMINNQMIKQNVR